MKKNNNLICQNCIAYYQKPSNLLGFFEIFNGAYMFETLYPYQIVYLVSKHNFKMVYCHMLLHTIEGWRVYSQEVILVG